MRPPTDSWSTKMPSSKIFHSKLKIPIFLANSTHFLKIQCCRKQVSAARLEAEKDGVVVPLTLEDYCIKTKVKPPEHSVDMTDFYDDDYDLDDEDEEDDDSGDGDYGDGDDSGNGES